ncbi:RIFT barrel domain-containing protein [Magnetospirillum molischianum]|uniref:PcRGLX/YetA-like N-terminal RIFT barrel domain-containing protein n=1 Tax=Magnetospirillum molischianum DSM 120 TaxID=1150626 RepID=H8FQA2_MAGML|nr:hypothetical protein [Magnetospirillum molischianum]CCG40540.1 conserved exported hypothetical protein [Magnetospirillum molischianum DSM 120]
MPRPVLLAIVTLACALAPPPAKAARNCPDDAIACVEVSNSGRASAMLPVTFGHPFAKGALPKGAVLMATERNGTPLPLQMDQIATHRDGSLRHAVISAILPVVAPRETVVVALKRGTAAPPPAITPIPASASSGHDIVVSATTYVPQISVVSFGNRQGQTPGTPFVEGEKITLILGTDPADTYTVTVDKKTAGGGYESLTRLSKAVADAINTGGRFHAFKWGRGDGYEKVWITPRDWPSGSFPIRYQYSGQASISVAHETTVKPKRVYTASSREALQAQKEAPPLWLSGPVAREAVLVAPLRDETGSPHPLLSARFYLRTYATGALRCDVVIENTWTYGITPGTVFYDISIARDGTEIYQHEGIGHYPNARWHRVVWSDGDPGVTVRHDLRALSASKAILNYDSTLTANPGALEKESERLRKADTTPLGNAFIIHYMPMVGARDDIGPLPRWTALWLISQRQSQKEVMLANADAGGSPPIHFRDAKTDLPVSLEDHPDISLFYNRGHNADIRPEPSYALTPWTPETNHMPSLSYVPYMVTGDLFYLEEVQFWANWALGQADPDWHREKSRGLMHANEQRGQAWTLRMLGQAAYITPDAHPMKHYFTARLKGNLDWYLNNVVHDPAASPLGFYMDRFHADQIAPWQLDFMITTLGGLAEQEVPGADEFLRALARFTVGRWTSEAQGYCHAHGPAYWLKTRHPDGALVRTWRELFTLNWPQVTSCPPPTAFIWGYPNLASGAVAMGRAALAQAATLSVPGAAEAFERLKAETPKLSDAMSSDPTWAIVPRQPAF